MVNRGGTSQRHGRAAGFVSIMPGTHILCLKRELGQRVHVIVLDRCGSSCCSRPQILSPHQQSKIPRCGGRSPRPRHSSRRGSNLQGRGAAQRKLGFETMHTNARPRRELCPPRWNVSRALPRQRQKMLMKREWVSQTTAMGCKKNS